MAKDPAVLFYTSDFLTGTAFFTDEQRGQYIRLLCEQHQNGHIPEKHMLSVSLSLGSPVIKKFVKDADGNFYNVRMEEEIEKRAHFLETRRDNGLKGGRPIKANAKANGKPYGKPTENLIENDNVNGNDILKRGAGENELNISFEIFWDAYGKKMGDKKRCEKKWNNLKNTERSKIMETLPSFLSSIRDKEFQPYPETYLNQQRWNDEIKPSKGPFGIPKVERDYVTPQTSF